MNFHIRVRRWVVWWFYVGVFCGGIALANIFGRNLTREQEHLLLVIGAVHWLLGGIVCWAFDAVKVRETPPKPQPHEQRHIAPDAEWHPASDFLQPGRRQSILPYSKAITRHSRKSL